METAGSGEDPRTAPQFGDGQDDVLALGLPPGRLAVVGFALTLAAAALRMPAPEPVRAAAGLVVLGLGSLLAWGSMGGVSLAAWAWRAAGLCLRGPSNRWTRVNGWTSVDGSGAERAA